MERSQVQAWSRRWKAVEERQTQEIRHQTPQERFRLLAVLMRFRPAHPEERPTEADKELMERWNRLKDMTRGRR